jgi:hypothetical protein
MLKNTYRNLLVSLVLLLASYPLLMGLGLWGKVIELMLATSVLVTGTMAASGRSMRATFAVSVSVAAVVTGILALLNPDIAWFFALRVMLFVVFLGLVIVVMSKHVFSGGRHASTTNRLYGAVCIYVLIGILFANLHLAIDILHPGSYICQAGQCGGNFQTSFQTGVHLYFSFITLATVGYGDIVPATWFAGMVAAMEAIIGQMYVAILVSRLVGLHLAGSGAEK